MTKINNEIVSKQDEQPRFCNIISGYLRGINGVPLSHPGQMDPKRTKVMTSQEIVLALADMADLELNDVAACMSYLGYCCGSWDGKVGWVIKIDHK